MSTLKLSILVFLCALVSACSQFAPFEDRRREPATEYIWIGSSKPNKPVFCYNPLFYSKEDILKLANERCQKDNPDSHAVLKDIDYFTCRLFVPSKAYYECAVDK